VLGESEAVLAGEFGDRGERDGEESEEEGEGEEDGGGGEVHGGGVVGDGRWSMGVWLAARGLGGGFEGTVMTALVVGVNGAEVVSEGGGRFREI